VSETTERFDTWAIVEAMGFKKYAGHVTTQELAGSSFIRVDVPVTSIPAFSKLIGAGSIYMITPTDEETARKAAAVLARGDSPLPVYIPEQRQLIAVPLPGGGAVGVDADHDDDDTFFPYDEAADHEEDGGWDVSKNVLAEPAEIPNP
jgi:hypothetical protein